MHSDGTGILKRTVFLVLTTNTATVFVFPVSGRSGQLPMACSPLPRSNLLQDFFNGFLLPVRLLFPRLLRCKR